MPSSITHTYFALDVYDNVNIEIQKKLKNHLEYYKTFSQGPDPIFFYNLSNLKIGKNIRNTYPSLIHNTNTQQFFLNIIYYILDNNLEENGEALSFLYGFITHYILDTTMHPFIIYKTGIFDKKNLSTYKYNGLHNEMEVYIDSYMIFKKENIEPKNFKIHKFIFNINKLSNETNNLLDNVFKNTYNIDSFSKVYYTSIKQMKYILKIYRYDKFGIKKFIYKMIDFILPKKYLKKEMLSYNINPHKRKHYLNMEKNEWNHPTNKYEYYKYSFVELYSIALKKAIKTINNVDDILCSKKDIEDLNKIFTNLSYVTGKDCDSNEKFQYFEF